MKSRSYSYSKKSIYLSSFGYFLSIRVGIAVVLIYSINGFSTKNIYTTQKNSIYYHHFPSGESKQGRFQALDANSLSDMTDLDDRTKYRVRKEFTQSLAIELLSGKMPEKVTQEFLTDWERKIFAVTNSLKEMQSINALLDVYVAILKTLAPKRLTPLQLSAFETLTIAIADEILDLNKARTLSVTELIDLITDRHLEYVDKFQAIVIGRDAEEM